MSKSILLAELADANFVMNGFCARAGQWMVNKFAP